MLLASVILAILVYGVISSMLGSLLPALGFTGAQNGTLALTQATGLAIAALFAGPLIDTRGKKTAMVAGLSAMAAALWLIPNATGNFQAMAVLWFLLGLGGGVMGTASNSLLSDIGGIERRAAVLNTGNLFFGVGLMITPFLASNVFAGSVRGSCYFAAVLVTGTLAVHAVIRMPARDTGNPFRWKQAGMLLRNSAMHWFMLFSFLYVATEVGVSNWLVKYLIAQGIPREHALKIMSLGFAFGLLTGRTVASRLLTRSSAANAVVVSAILITLTTIWILYSGPGEIGAAVSVFCAGLAMSAAFPTLLSLVADAFPTATGTALGLVTTSGWAGLAVSSSLIGVIAGADGVHLGKALLLFPVFSAGMVGVSLAIRSRLSRTQA